MPETIDIRVIRRWEEQREVHEDVYSMTKEGVGELLDALPFGCYDELAKELRIIQEDLPSDALQHRE